MEEDATPIRLHTFEFNTGQNDHVSLQVECRKTLKETLNFRLTVQCEVDELFESLRGFGGGWESDSGDEKDPTAKPGPPAAPAALPGQEEAEDNVSGKPDLLGLDIWPAAIELCNYLAKHPSLVRNKRIIELGAGVGLPGLLAARLGASTVVLTDYEPQVVNFMARNASLNGLSSTSGFLLDWTRLDTLPEEHRNSYNLVLAADVLYISELMPGFVDSICALLSNSDPEAVVIIGHQKRRALVMQGTTPEMVDIDVAFGNFCDLIQKKSLIMRELGSRESPGFPGPLLMLALVLQGNERRLREIPDAFPS